MQIEMPKNFETSQTKPANIPPRLRSILRFHPPQPGEFPFPTNAQ